VLNRELDLRSIAKPYMERLRKIKVALFDVDGVLTNGQVYWSGQEVGFNRFFHVQDGYGLKVLKNAGLKVGIITGGDSEGVIKRFSLLGLDYMHIGNEDKRSAYLEVKKEANVDDEEILYMGDEFFDLPLIEKCGFGATVPHASLEVREVADYVTQREGGEGAVREVIDMLRYAQNIVPPVPGFDE
jgi:3-deoxy-D-manno-octulosonate 8-phosphate phosphatase (KDO 8-P phosphatase)